MPGPEDAAAARWIVAALGFAVGSSTLLQAEGAGSVAWRVDLVEGDPLVVRFARPRSGKSSALESDAGVRERLRSLDSRTPTPVATNGSHPAIDGPDAWSVDRYIEGSPLVRGALPRVVCDDLGAVLRALHALPATGWGRLQDRRDKLRGASPDAWDVATRFQDPWPLAGSPLADHALARAAPALLDRLYPFEGRISRAPNGEPVVVHGDLHEKQLRVRDGRLLALIDFGEAMVGEAAWDIASFAYFHGWGRAGWLLAAYEPQAAARASVAARSAELAVPLAMHQASRAETLDRPVRMARAVTFLGETLGLLDGATSA